MARRALDAALAGVCMAALIAIVLAVHGMDLLSLHPIAPTA